jgi:hypothetical protein
MTEVEPSLGDNVRIRATNDTTASGHAGKAGVCYGFTTPSVTGVDVIGSSDLDRAYNVGFEEGVDAWFAPDLVEIIDHAPGTEITVGNEHLVRDAEGNWHKQRRFFKRR